MMHVSQKSIESYRSTESERGHSLHDFVPIAPTILTLAPSIPVLPMELPASFTASITGRVFCNIFYE